MNQLFSKFISMKLNNEYMYIMCRGVRGNISNKRSRGGGGGGGGANGEMANLTNEKGKFAIFRHFSPLVVFEIKHFRH